MFEKSRGLPALLVLALAAALAGYRASSATPPIEAYGQLPNIQEMDLSPDGEHLAVLVGDGAIRRVQIRNASDLKLLTTAPVDKFKIRSLMWAGPDHLLILYSQTTDVWGLSGPAREWGLGIDYDLKRKHYSPLMEAQEKSLNTIFGDPIYRHVKGRDFVYFIGEYFPGDQASSPFTNVTCRAGTSTRLRWAVPIPTTGWSTTTASRTCASTITSTPADGPFTSRLEVGGSRL